MNDCAFSTKIQLAFRGVGNAIATPHAILAIAVALHSVGQAQVDPLQAVRQAWALRRGMLFCS